MQISAPKSTEKALEKLLDKMYISNVSKRLRELNQPNDIDRKRWIWELLQNAKDTITNNPKRDSIKARILIDGDSVKFQHDGDPLQLMQDWGYYINTVKTRKTLRVLDVLERVS